MKSQRWLGMCALAFALCMGTAIAQDKRVDLKLSTWPPPQHPLNPSLQAWAEDIKKASGGSIVATLFPSLIQAKTFHEATPIGAIIVTKLDGTSRGGGALSAVAATSAPIKFIGTGEKIEDLEAFTPSRFVGRLLGMGDLETLLEKVKEAEIKVPQKKAKAILSGKFTLTDMYEQFEAMKGMGPFRKVLQMLPGMSANVPEEMLNTAEGRLEKWRVVIQ